MTQVNVWINQLEVAMNNKWWRLLEVLPMLVYLTACIAYSAYFLYSFMGLYVDQAQVVAELTAVL